MLSQEILWESLHSMNRSRQKSQRVITVHEFLVELIEVLSQQLSRDPFELVVETLKNRFVGIECFILKVINDDYGKVIASTQIEENNYLWPLIGPLRRRLNGQRCIVFNTQRIPILKSFPPVLTHHIVSMLMSTIELNQSNYMLLMTHSEVGHFDKDDQYLLNELARLLSQQRDRFKFAAIGLEREVMSSSDVHHTEKGSSDYLKSLSPLLSEQSMTSMMEKTVDQQYIRVKNNPTIREGSILAGRYKIISKLGEGGQGDVYHSHDTLLKRSVAIKMANVEDTRSSKPHIDQLIREASLAANIHHPNVVQIYDIGFHSQKQVPFIVMEYLIGQDLGKRLAQRGPFTLRTLIPLFIPVLEALAQAHSSGLVHRDLKPQNLFLVSEDTPQEHLRILDFGIALLMSHQAEDPKDISGTLSYLAPEYLRYKIISPQIDVYQMGLIFIELLVGQRVFTYDSFYKVMIDINMGFEIPMSISNPLLRTILTQSTALDPAERYATCHEFAEDLKGFMRNDLSQQSASSVAISPLDNTSLDNTALDNTSLDNKAETPTTVRLSITDIIANSGK